MSQPKRPLGFPRLLHQEFIIDFNKLDLIQLSLLPKDKKYLLIGNVGFVKEQVPDLSIDHVELDSHKIKSISRTTLKRDDGKTQDLSSYDQVIWLDDMQEPLSLLPENDIICLDQLALREFDRPSSR